MDQTLTTGVITNPTLQRAFGEVDLFIEKGAYVDVFNPVLQKYFCQKPTHRARKLFWLTLLVVWLRVIFSPPSASVRPNRFNGYFAGGGTSLWRYR